MARNIAGQRGFTLLEVLIALTLLGVLAGLLYGGLRFGTRVWEQGTDAAMGFGDVVSAQALCRRQLRAALPLPLMENGEQSGRFFEGTATAMRFFAPAPAEVLVPGVYELELKAFAASEIDGVELRMSWRLLTADQQHGAEPFHSEVAGDAILLAGAAAIRFLYLGASLEDHGDWQEGWMWEGVLPALVRIEVSFASDDRRSWPLLTVAPAAVEIAR
jgi:general secretion pathway protein J